MLKTKPKKKAVKKKEQTLPVQRTLREILIQMERIEINNTHTNRRLNKVLEGDE